MPITSVCSNIRPNDYSVFFFCRCCIKIDRKAVVKTTFTGSVSMSVTCFTFFNVFGTPSKLHVNKDLDNDLPVIPDSQFCTESPA
jgi:hypothetical protein